MVDPKYVVCVSGIPSDAKVIDLVHQFSKAGDVEYVLPVQEAHSGCFTGRGYVVYKDEDSAVRATGTLTGTSLEKSKTLKFTVCAADSSHVAEITTLLGRDRLDDLHLSAITGTGLDFVTQLTDKLSSLADSEVLQLVSNFKTARGDAVIPHGPALAASYSVHSPKLPTFTGARDQVGSYEHWRSQVRTLLSDRTNSEMQILSAIHQSVKGTAGSVLLSMPEGSTTSDVLETFDTYFGNVLPLDILTNQFHSSLQEPNEDVVSWSCRLRWLLGLIHQKQPMSGSEYQRLLRSKFWNGLVSSDMQEATRYRYECDESFNEIFTACRTYESRPKKKGDKKAVSAHQMTSQPDSSFDKLFKRLDSMESRFNSRLDRMDARLDQVERTQTASAKRKPAPATVTDSSSSNSRELYCSRCRRNTHTAETCHAKRDKYGKWLN